MKLGFSTGAIAKGDFRRALEILAGTSARAVELSALRETELAPLLTALPGLDLRRYEYVSLHAPSRFSEGGEKEVAAALRGAKCHYPVVLHPDAIVDFACWSDFGDRVLIENTDKRKSGGQKAKDLEKVFKELPEASLCLDLGHAKQVDPTMAEATLILRHFGDRLVELHVSEVNSQSGHEPLSYSTLIAIDKVSHLLPADVAIILESIVEPSQVQPELDVAAKAFAGPEPATR